MRDQLVTPFPIHFDLSFNLDRSQAQFIILLFQVFILVVDILQQALKLYSIQPLPYGSIIDNGAITYSGGSVGNNYVYSIYGEIANILSNQTYTVFVVAEEISTGILSTFYQILCHNPPLSQNTALHIFR